MTLTTKKMLIILYPMSDANAVLNRYAELNNALLKYVEILENRLINQLSTIRTIVVKSTPKENNFIYEYEELKSTYKNLKEHVKLATETNNLVRLSNDLRYFEEFDKKELERKIYNLETESKFMTNEIKEKDIKINIIENKEKELKMQINYLLEIFKKEGNESYVKLIRKLLNDIETLQPIQSIENKCVDKETNNNQEDVNLIMKEQMRFLELKNIEYKDKLEQKMNENNFKDLEIKNLLLRNKKLEEDCKLMEEMKNYVRTNDSLTNDYKMRYEKIYEELIRLSGPSILEIERLKFKAQEFMTELNKIKGIAIKLENSEFSEKLKVKDEQISKLKKVVEELKKIRLEYLKMKETQTNTEE